MTDKELIKKEIERRMNISIEQGYTYSAAQLKRVIDFIDSLPEEPASKDLDEYYTREFLPKEWFAKPGQRTISQFNFFTAHHFAEWQKQQMMKDAVEGEVVYQIGSAEIAPTDIQYKVVSDRVYIPNVKLGDKVKIIIVKTKQQ